MNERSPRLFETTCPIFDGPEGHEEVVATVPYAIDLEEVIIVRGDDRDGGRSLVATHSGPHVIDAPFAEVFAAWRAYRRWSDSYPLWHKS